MKVDQEKICPYCKGKSKVRLPSFCDPCYIKIPEHLKFSSENSNILVCEYGNGALTTLRELK